MKKLVLIVMFIALMSVAFAGPQRLTYDSVSNPVQLEKFLRNPMWPGNMYFWADIYFDGSTAGYDIQWDKSENTLEVLDNAVVAVGTGDDYTISHNGSTTTLAGAATHTGVQTFSSTAVFNGGQTRKVMYLPSDVELDGTNPPGTTSVGTDGQAVFDALNFDATGSDGDDLVFINWVVPDGYTADSATLNVYWSYSDAEDAADDIEIDGTVNAVAAGEALDAAGTAMDAVAATMSGDTDNDKLIKTTLDIEVEDIAVGDIVNIMFFVDESASELASSGTADVHYFEIEYESTE